MHALRLIPGILVILLLAIAPAAAQETPKGPAKPAQVTEEKEKHSPLPTRTIPLAFIWLAEHQSRDGSWRFDPPAGDKKGFKNPGTWNSPTAATALSLWPFLAAGQTHMTKGTNRERVSAGLLWLMKHQGPDGDLSAGCSRAMFAHAFGTMVLCEADYMTVDKKLGAAAQQALNFLITSQDKKTGGWTQDANQLPTLSLTTAAIMALRSGQIAQLKVRQSALKDAARFVRSMKARDGLQYGETSPIDVSQAATAFGLVSQSGAGSPGTPYWYPLLREDDDKDAEARGFDYLVQAGLAKNDCVYNFFAANFIHRCGGDKWDAWNRKMRAHVILSQVREGAETGSWWNPEDLRAVEGGRLFQTAINPLMLEVYYGYPKIYKIEEATSH